MFLEAGGFPGFLRLAQRSVSVFDSIITFFFFLFFSKCFIHFFFSFFSLSYLIVSEFTGILFFFFLLSLILFYPEQPVGMLVSETLRSIDSSCSDYGVQHLFLRKVLK